VHVNRERFEILIVQSSSFLPRGVTRALSLKLLHARALYLFHIAITCPRGIPFVKERACFRISDFTLSKIPSLATHLPIPPTSPLFSLSLSLSLSLFYLYIFSLRVPLISKTSQIEHGRRATRKKFYSRNPKRFRSLLPMKKRRCRYASHALRDRRDPGVAISSAGFNKRP